ncbi:MAG: hypothetical protein ACREOC_07510 [Gemmatimonadales bacterium]
MTFDALTTPGTILAVALAALAAPVLFRSRRPADTVEPEAGGGTGELPGCDADRCRWKVHVVGVAHRRCTVVVSGRPVHLKRGDLLLALRPTAGESTSVDLPHAS